MSFLLWLLLCVLKVFTYPKIYEDVFLCFLLEILLFYVLVYPYDPFKIFMYGARCAARHFHFSSSWNPIDSMTFIKRTTLSPLTCDGIFVINQVTALTWACFWCSFSLFCLSFHQYHVVFILRNFKIGPWASFFFRIFFAVLGPLYFPTTCKIISFYQKTDNF